MNREHHRWYSPSLGRHMDLLVFGHAGARMLVYPSSMGKFFEWEDRGMVDALGEHLSRGWLQMFCVDSVDEESWYAKWKHPAERAWRQTQYENYVLHEVLPLSWDINPHPYLITTGASFGAYHAADLAFRHPWVVNRMIGLSGLYDVKENTEGYSDDAVYAHDPSQYLVHENDPYRLDALRRMNIILATGQDDSFRGNNEYISRVLWDKGVGNALRLWDGWAHDWPWWRQMIQMYVGGHE
ncbi:alpha/beta hydrolase-fold protein [soil metagenome]